jgi:hypothetical protein
VVHERVPRWNPNERAMGWHRQYESINRFVRERRELIEFDSTTFYERFVVQRLTGVGIFDQPPEWATPPAW